MGAQLKFALTMCVDCPQSGSSKSGAPCRGVASSVTHSGLQQSPHPRLSDLGVGRVERCKTGFSRKGGWRGG